MKNSAINNRLCFEELGVVSARIWDGKNVNSGNFDIRINLGITFKVIYDIKV